MAIERAILTYEELREAITDLSVENRRLAAANKRLKLKVKTQRATILSMVDDCQLSLFPEIVAELRAEAEAEQQAEQP